MQIWLITRCSHNHINCQPVRQIRTNYYKGEKEARRAGQGDRRKQKGKKAKRQENKKTKKQENKKTRKKQEKNKKTGERTNVFIE